MRYAETVTVRSEGTLQVRVEGSLPAGPLPADVEVALYRIVLEAVTNVARHAVATQCLVRLAADGPALRLSVEDDGTGLPATPRPGGLGLRSMRERAVEIGGSCPVSGRPDGGTVVDVTVPLEGR